MNQHYEFKGRLGTGDSQIYQGYDHFLGREVVIKRLFPENGGVLDESGLRAEVKKLSGLSHPNIVTIFEYAEDETGPFVVLESIDGQNLEEVVGEGLLTEDDFFEVADQIFDAFVTAEKLKIVHQAIKPGNIMLSMLPSDKCQIKILDFGISRLSTPPSEDSENEFNFSLNTSNFLAPEQLLMLEPNHQTDLYAIGCVLYFVLTGRPPFAGSDVRSTITNHLESIVTPLEELRPDLSARSCDLVMSLISRRPEDRPDNALEAMEGLTMDCIEPEPEPEHVIQVAITPPPPPVADDCTLYGPGAYRVQSESVVIPPPPPVLRAVPPNRHREQPTTRRNEVVWAMLTGIGMVVLAIAAGILFTERNETPYQINQFKNTISIAATIDAKKDISPVSEVELALNVLDLPIPEAEIKPVVVESAIPVARLVEEIPDIPTDTLEPAPIKEPIEVASIANFRLPPAIIIQPEPVSLEIPVQTSPTPTPLPKITKSNFRTHPSLNTPVILLNPDLKMIQLAVALVTNETRLIYKKSPLDISSQLTQAAQMHADDMKTYRFLSHTNKVDLSRYDPKTRAATYGVFLRVTENINRAPAVYFRSRMISNTEGATGSPAKTPLALAESLVAYWMNFDEQRQNILDDEAKSIGCGISICTDNEFQGMPSVYAVQNFANISKKAPPAAITVSQTKGTIPSLAYSSQRHDTEKWQPLFKANSSPGLQFRKPFKDGRRPMTQTQIRDASAYQDLKLGRITVTR